MGEKLVDIKQGPIRVTIEANRKALAIFSQKEQNNIIRGAMGAVGAIWVAVFLPKRFTDYARRFLRYNPRASWEAAKDALLQSKKITKNGLPVKGPQPTPLVFTGVSRAAALAGARGVPKATKNRAYVVIKIPLGHAVRKETANVVKFMPHHEVKRVGEEFKKALVDGIAGSFMGGNAKAPGRRAPAGRQSLAA